MTRAALPAFGAHRPPLDPASLARRIVSEPRFRMQIHAREDWWTRFWTWFWSKVAALFGHGGSAPPGIVDLIGDIVLFAAACLVIYFVVRLLRSIVRDAPAQQQFAARTIERKTAAREWYERAMAAAAQGRYGAAVVLLFRATLAILDLRGVVHDDPSRTVNESRAELLRSAPQFAAGFNAVARTFTAALYAEDPVSNAQWEEARGAYDALHAAVHDAT